MAKSVDEITEEIRKLPDVDQVWAEEARKRWAAYKAGKLPTVSYDAVMTKYRHS
jgi:hypothetical protein